VNDNKLKRINSINVKDFVIISDFDRTLIQTSYRGKKITSMISILRENVLIDVDYTKRAEQMFNYYHKIEIDPNIPIDKKIRYMEEWWRKHYQLLIEKGISKDLIKKVVNSRCLRLRKYVYEFLLLTFESKIPVIIISANGLGDYGIKEFLKRYNVNFSNIVVVSNKLVFRSDGRLIGIKEPLIHTYYKYMFDVTYFPTIRKITKNRSSAFVLGDSIVDATVGERIIKGTLIKIGFLDDEKLFDEFKKHYDIVLPGNASFKIPLQLLKSIIGNYNFSSSKSAFIRL